MRDWLLGLDPGLQRLRGAIRALLAIVAAEAVLYAIGRVWPVPLAAMMLAGVAAMLGSRTADADRRQRLITTALLPLPLLLAASVVAAIGGAPAWVAYAVLVIVVYLAVEARRFGPRGMLLGMAGVMGFFMARYIGVKVAQLGAVVPGPIVAALVTMTVRELIVGDAPRATLRWSLRAFRAQARRLARLLLQPEPGHTPRSRSRIEKALGRLNACALAVDAALDAPALGIDAARRSRFDAALTDAELVVEHCAAAMLWAKTTADRETTRAALTALAALVGHRHGAAARIAASLAPVRAPEPRPATTVRTQAQPKTPAEPTKRAVQAAIACATAIGAGQWLSPTRWYWALIAAFVVFAGTASSGETLQKVWARVLGTVLGVAIGIALVAVVGTDRIADAALIAVLAFIGFYLQPVSYLAMTLCITVILGLVYALIGQSTENLLTLRLEETAIGAFFGGAAALTLFPVHTHDAIALAIASYLKALDDSVAASIEMLLGAAPKTAPRDASRALDQSLRDLLARSQPVLDPLPFLAPPQDQRETIAALAWCSYFARDLGRSAERAEPRRDASAQARYRSLQTRIRAAADVVTAKSDAASVASDVGSKRNDDSTHSDDAIGSDDLEQIARILESIARISTR